MKAKFLHRFRIVSIFIFLTSFSISAFTQTNTYNESIKNIVFTDCRHLEFEIWIEWTGTNTHRRFQTSQSGIDFNYLGLANGGILTGAFQPGSADPNLPVIQQSPNWNINQVSKQIRFFAAIATPASVAYLLPPPPGIRLGKFVITNSVDFSPGATPNFSWSFTTGSATTTSTLVTFYLGSSISATNITNPSQHFIESNPPFNLSCILPIELIYFNAAPMGDKVLCSWETTSEINNEYFEVESNDPGDEFKALGRVNGFGAGITSTARKYSFVDERSCEGIRYYRLKQTDIDGSFSYSNTVVIDCRNRTGLDIWPNPATENITFQFYSPVNSELKISIVDISGKVTRDENIFIEKGINRFTRTVTDMASGSYFLRIISEDNELINLRNLFLKK